MQQWLFLILNCRSRTANIARRGIWDNNENSLSLSVSRLVRAVWESPRCPPKRQPPTWPWPERWFWKPCESRASSSGRSIFYWDQNFHFLCLQLNFVPNLCGCGRYAHAKRGSRGKMKLDFYLRIWQFSHTIVILLRIYLQPCMFCRSSISTAVCMIHKTHADSADTVAPIDLQSDSNKSLLALLLLPVPRRSQ